MTRQAVAYLLMVLLVVGLIAVVAGTRYYSRDRVVQRQKAKDRARRQRTSAQLEKTSE